MLLKRLHKVALFVAAHLLYGTLTSSANAQSWPARWLTTGTADDQGECITVDKRGNVIVAGPTKHWNGSWDVQVLKYDAGGTLIWERHYDGPGSGGDEGDDYPTAIHVDDDLNVYVGGTSWGGSTTNYDLFVWKLDTDGVRVWPNTGGGTGYAFDSLGAVRTTATTHEGYNPSQGVKSDMAVRDAVLPQDRTIAVTGAGSSVTGGFSRWWHTVVFEQNSTGTSCSLKSGWPVTWPGPNTSKSIYPEAVAIYSDNTVYVTGLTYSTSGLYQNFTTIRYKANGTNGGSGTGTAHWYYEWNEGEKDACGMDIVLDRDGNAYATGYVQPDTTHDYGVITIDKNWNMGSDPGRYIWDSGEKDESVSIDLTYEVESSVLKTYVYVTGTAGEPTENSNIATLRLDSTLVNLEWDEVYTNSTHDDVGLMVVGAGAGNAYVIGRSNNDYVLLGYRRNGTQRSFSPVTYDGPATGNDFDEGRALAMAGAGLVRATGESAGSGTNKDFATIQNTESPTAGRPDSEDIQLGSSISGNLSNLLADDNSYRVYESNIENETATPEKIIVEFGLASPISATNDPSEICLRYVGKCSVTNIKLKIEIYNWVSTSWETLDYRKVGTADSPVTMVIKNDPDCYITGSNPEIKLRLSWDESLGSQTNAWTASVNQLAFELIGT